MSGDFFTRLAVRALSAGVGLRPALGEVDLIAGRHGVLDDEAEPPTAAPTAMGPPLPQLPVSKPLVVVEVGPTEIRPLQEIDSVVAAARDVPPPIIRADPSRVAQTPVVVEPASHSSTERRDSSSTHHHTQRIDARSERVVERVVDLRPSPAAVTGNGHHETRDPAGQRSSPAAPRVEIHIGRLEIGESRRRPAVDDAPREPRREAPVAPALGLSEYLAARNNG